MSETKRVKREEIKDWGEVCTSCKGKGIPHLHYYAEAKSPKFKTYEECYNAQVKGAESFVNSEMQTQPTADNTDPIIDNGSLHPMRRSEYFDPARLERLAKSAWETDRCQISLMKAAVNTLNEPVDWLDENSEKFLGWVVVQQ